MNPLNTVKIKNGDSYRIINESDFKHGAHELCEGEKLSTTEQITVSLSAKISPELQKVIDDAKAECEKVAGENTILKEQLATLQGELIQAQNKIVELEAIITKQNDVKPEVDAPTQAETKAKK